MIKSGIKAYQFAKAFKNYKNSTDEIERIKFAKMLNRLFQEQGGIFLKFAQYLGTDPLQAQEIQDLSFSIDQTVSLDEIKKIIQEYYNKNWDQLFKDINPKGHSASIGQVHRSILLNNEEVALKIQYPNIRKKIDEQMSLLNLLPTSKPEKKWGIDINGFKKMINDLIDKELNYSLESNIQIKAYQLYQKYPYLKIPKIYEELTTEKMIISEFIEGLTIDEIKDSSVDDRLNYAKNLLKAFLVMLKEGLFQGDSNHGNFLFIPKDNQVVLLDYGQMVELDPQMHKAAPALILKMINDHEINFGDFFITLGFNEEKLEHIHDSLGIISKIIFEPFLMNRPFDLTDWDYKSKLDLVLGENKWWFRSAGGVDFFLVMKSFMGIKNLIQKLKVNINWQECFAEVYKDDISWMREYTPTKKATKLWNSIKMGQKVQIIIRENGQDKINLNLPYNILYSIEDVLDEDVLKKLIDNGYDVKALAQKALASSLQTQTIFELVDKNKEYSVKVI